MRKKFNQKSKNGITLIALVITIIILIILVGITLNLSISDSGIISRTENATNNYNYDTEYEELNSIILEAQAKNIRNKQTLKSIVKFLLDDTDHNYSISTSSEFENIVNDVSDLTDDISEIFILYNNFKFSLDSDIHLHKIK